VRKKTVYLSSTFSDLQELRSKASQTIRKLGYDCVAMEDYVASDERPLDRCLDDVRRCDIYVGLIAWRYGHIPRENNPERLSITELEYRHARRLEKKRLIFLLDERVPWPPAFVDPGIGPEVQHDRLWSRRIRSLREELTEDRLTTRFTGTDDLCAQLAIALGPGPRVPRPPRFEKLPASATMDDLVGRTAQLSFLHQCFEDKETAVVAVVGDPGIGKSHLVKVFLDRLAAKDPPYLGAQWKYAWSFYNQDTNTAENSSTEFFADALRHFGFEGYYVSEEQRAVKLAEVLSSEKTILVLDGIDPLQATTAGEDQAGRFQDAAIRKLLFSLCRASVEQGFIESLVIVTSTASLFDLKEFAEGAYREIPLGPLEEKEGAELLGNLLRSPVEPTELHRAVREVKGQPLTLTLLGRALRAHCDGDIRRRGEVLLAGAHGELDDATRAVLEWYRQRWCEPAEDSTVIGARCLSFLKLVSLVGRPMSDMELEFLAQGKIALGQPLAAIGKEGLQQVGEHLQTLGLLIRKPDESWDTHSTVRRFFRDLLLQEDESGWIEAHRALYHYFLRISKKKPRTSQEMESVTRAVHHACFAGQFRDAHRLYRDRVARRSDGYITENLGLVAWDLTILSRFFPGEEHNWWRHAVGVGLRRSHEIWLRSRVAYGLELQGRLQDAQQQRRTTIDYLERKKQWRDLADAKEKLALILARTADLREARTMAEEAVQHADRARETAETGCTREWEGACERQIHCLTVLGAICHRLNEPLDEVKKLFSRAETIHREREIRRQSESGTATPDISRIFLHSEPGCRYCVVLLSDGKTNPNELLERSSYMSQWWKSQHSDPNVRKKPGFMINAVHELTKGRILMAMADRMPEGDSRKRNTYYKAAADLDSAIALVQLAHNVPYQCQPLLARADLKHRMGEFKGALHDLEEVIRIAGEMRLYKAEAKLALAEIKLERSSASGHDPSTVRQEVHNLITDAEKLITSMHYERKLKDLARVKKKLGDLPLL